MQWEWKRLGDEVESARRACVPTTARGHVEAATRFQRAIAAVWPPGFFDALEGCKRGDPRGLDDVLDFVEACPKFFSSGYILGKAVRWLSRPPRSAVQAERMRQIVLKSVARQLRVPFRRIPALARAVDSASLGAGLRDLIESPSFAIRERAGAALDLLPGVPWDGERARQTRQDNRARSMVVTAQNRRSATLLRRTLTIDPGSLTTRGRSFLAVAFEFAMNWDLIPKEELVAIARKIDGAEMEPVWRFALERQDGPGDRARWLTAQLGGR